MIAPADSTATVQNQLSQDPLDAYSREDLLALIEAQGAENNDLRQRADQFEHLYRDVMGSTAWKLSWPIRAAFKVLTAAKNNLSNLLKKKQKQATQAPEKTLTGEAVFDARLPYLQFFVRPTPIARINLLISIRQTAADLAALLSQVSRVAAQLDLSVRIIALDPELTACACSQTGVLSTNWTFQSVETPASGKNVFRLDFHPEETVWVQTHAARQLMSQVVANDKITLLDGGH